MKIVLHDKDTFPINIICIVADIISICLADINWIASALLFSFSILFDLIAIRKLYKKKQSNVNQQSR